jgi:hypothetical protein
MGLASKMKKLHTVSYNNLGEDFYIKNTLVIKEGPPSLKRLSLDNFHWWEVGCFVVCSAQLLIWFTGN